MVANATSSNVLPFRGKTSETSGGRGRLVPGGVVGEENKEVRPAPSFADIAAAMKVLQSEPQGLNRHISMIIVAAIIGIGAWMLNGISNVQTTVTTMSATMTSMQKSIDVTLQRSDAMVSSQSDMKTSLARLEQRVNALEGGRRGVNGQSQAQSAAGSGDSGLTGGF